MAIVPGTNYSSQTAVDAVNFPQGKAQNVSVTGAGDGTPLEEAWLNDLWGFQQALLAAAAITPSGVPDTAVTSQYLQALHAIFPNRIISVGNLNAAISVYTNNTSGFVVVYSLAIGTAAAGDKIDLTINLAAHMGSGAGTVRIFFNEGATLGLDQTDYAISSTDADNIFSVSLAHTVANPGTLTVVITGSGGSGTLHASLPNGSNNNFGRYQLIRP